MPAFKTIKLILSLSIAFSIIVFFADFTRANKFRISEGKPMAQNTDNDPEENRVFGV
jgi:hypothetical protein